MKGIIFSLFRVCVALLVCLCCYCVLKLIYLPCKKCMRKYLKRSRSDPDIATIGPDNIPEESHGLSNPSYALPRPIHASKSRRRRRKSPPPPPNPETLTRRPLRSDTWMTSGDIVAPVYDSIQNYTSGSPPILTPTKYDLSEVPVRRDLPPIPPAPERIRPNFDIGETLDSTEEAESTVMDYFTSSVGSIYNTMRGRQPKKQSNVTTV